jgi:hypothetical protein
MLVAIIFLIMPVVIYNHPATPPPPSLYPNIVVYTPTYIRPLVRR